MPHMLFSDYCPDIARKETRSISVVDGFDLPRDDYGLLEMYCDEAGCDCRRVFLNVLSRKRGQSMAAINFG